MGSLKISWSNESLLCNRKLNFSQWEPFINCIFVSMSRGEKLKTEEVLLNNSMSYEIFVTMQIAVHRTCKEPQCDCLLTLLPAWNGLWYVLSALYAKGTERRWQGYSVLTVCCGSRYWGAAVGCLHREHLGERVGTLSFHIIHFRKQMKKNSLKWLKLQNCS
jgi:hypothetical protein